MIGQQKREEGLLAAMRGLQASLPASQPQQAQAAEQRPGVSNPAPEGAASPSAESMLSLRGLPTPAPRQRRSSPIATPESRGGGGEEHSRADARPYGDPKIPQYVNGEDIENYLLRFERIAKTWAWPQEEWACRLVPLLSGKALEAYTAMDEERAHLYPDLRAALLAKFDISPETYRQQFRSSAVPPGENPTETYHRLKGLYRRWIRPEQHTKEQIGEQIILEQLLRVLPADICTWVKEHEPADGLAASKLALQYINARKGGPAAHPGGPSRQLLSQPRPAVRSGYQPPGDFNTAPNQRGPGKELICFYCQQPGHKASLCPIRKAKLTGACYTPRAEAVNAVGRRQRFKDITVNGQPVTALLDSGSFLTLVRRDLVPTGMVDFSRQEDILCVHGDRHAYPTADLTVGVNGQAYLLSVGVVEKLPVAAILGWDLPVLLDVLLEEEGKDTDCEKGVLGPVITRAQARAEVTSKPKLTCEPQTEPFSTLDDSLFEGGTKGPRKSRRQRRFEKGLKSREPDCKEGLIKDRWEVPEDIGAMQREDASLKSLFDKVVGGLDSAKGDRECFVLEKDVLYAVADGVKRLVVPVSCRPMILHLAHSLPWAGHLGRNKTFLRMSSRFYWPSMYADVQMYCKTCPICQKTSYVRQSDRAYLQPMPVISTPFRRIAMDIVGPLVKSSRGHQYILVLSDYATRFPEAFPLHTVTAPAVLRCLVQLFSRVGIPDEIVTDQGTNFTSRLLQLFHRQLGISPLKTTPYHPQTDSLVERFNQTLKKMLQKFVLDTGRDWDRWLPFLLFAYREVPQASTGFSPFELLYGWDVQGPLDLLRKGWEAPSSTTSDRTVVQYVLEMRDRLALYRDEAEINLRKAQQSQKAW
uniref:Gypsy retrotransposon integrase-like protein 1 n=1 Tax=Amphiprion ocellaris TaxID=80972 RepID=A0AAQ5XHE4_AMPOC